MVRQLEAGLTDLFDSDETSWLEMSSRLIREGRFDELDFAHLAEYLNDMARRDKREVNRRLAVLIAHLLKWKYQPGRRTNGWRATIEVQRRNLAELLEAGSLRLHALESLERAYGTGVLRAVAETNLDASTFPETCAYSLDDLLAEEWDAE